MPELEKVGILGYGVVIPREKIEVEKIVRKRERKRKDLDDYADKVKNGLGLHYKSIAGACEDSTTLAQEAAENAFRMAGIDPKKIGIDPKRNFAIHVGTESKPYAVGTIAVEVASFLGIGPYIFVADVEGACNAGMQTASDIRSKVKTGEIFCGLAIGTDVAQAPKRDPLEYASGAGAGALLIGKNDSIEGFAVENELVAELYDVSPYATNCKDFFRRELMPFPKHFGKTTIAAYIKHVIGAMGGMIEKHPNLQLRDFHKIITHQPSKYMPEKTFKVITGESTAFKLEDFIENADVRERMRLTTQEVNEKVFPWILTSKIGNTYAAATTIALANALDNAKPGEDILAVSYGSGASSIATWVKVLDGIERKRGIVPTVEDYINRSVEIRLENYLDAFEERVVRWAKRKHLIFPKIIGEIEPSNDNDGKLEFSLCNDCKTIYYPKKDTCLDTSCRREKLITKSVPKKAKLVSYQKPIGKPSIMKSVYHVLEKNQVILVDCNPDDLEIGTRLEPVVRRFDYHGKDGLIEYGPAFRPVFRDAYPRQVRQEKVAQMIAQ